MKKVNRNKIIESDMEYIIQKTYIPWELLRNRTILISGAAGFLPAYMVETLLYLNEKKNCNIKIIALVRNLEKAQSRFLIYKDREELEIIKHDITIPYVFNEKLDCVIHAASNASPKYYGLDPVGTLSTNTTGTLNLLENCHQNPIQSFLYFSSGEVYGELSDAQIPTKETQYGYLDPLQVRSCYAESKKMGENICISYYHQYKVPVKIVRPFHTYGPGMNLEDGRVFADFVSNIIHNENICLNSDGSAKRAFCYLADAVAGFFTVLLRGDNGKAYNVGNPIDISILELAHKLVGLYPEKKLKIEINNKKNTAGYIASKISRNCPNIDEIEHLGWKPKISIEEGFKRTIESFK